MYLFFEIYFMMCVGCVDYLLRTKQSRLSDPIQYYGCDSEEIRTPTDPGTWSSVAPAATMPATAWSMRTSRLHAARGSQAGQQDDLGGLVGPEVSECLEVGGGG